MLCGEKLMQIGSMLYAVARCVSLSAHGGLANENLQSTPGHALSSAVGSGLPGSRKLSVVERPIGSLASTECAGGVGSLGLRSEREGHI